VSFRLIVDRGVIGVKVNERADGWARGRAVPAEC
jgi:hypothetical protein